MGSAPDQGTPAEGRVPVWSNRWMTLRALGWLVLLRSCLALLPFRSVLALQRRAGRVRVPARPRSHVPRLARAVERARRYLPGKDTCLPEALAGQVLLARAGYASELRIGVAAAEGPGGPPLDAHAWLECEGHVVLGEAEEGRYTPLEEFSPREPDSNG